MFTGIVDAVGRVAKATRETGNGKRAEGLALTIQSPYRGVKKGESIAVNGACLTVEKVVKGTFTVHAIATTLDRTLIGDWRKGQPVNLERALRAGDRLGGHFVQCHIDCSAKVISFERTGEDYRLEVDLPPDFAHYAAYKGSVAINGISLTIAELLEKSFAVWIIPHTKRHTNIDNIGAVDLVNIEFDILAKYVERMLARYAPQD